jgi:hypothetical protein
MELPESNINEKITKLILWRCRNRSDGANACDKLDDLFNEVKKEENAEELYQKIYNKMLKGAYCDFMNNSWEIDKKRKQEEKLAKEQERKNEAENLCNFLKQELKTYDNWSNAMYKMKTGRGISKDFISFVINDIEYNCLGDIELIGKYIYKDGAFVEEKENFAILELSETLKLFGKITTKKRTLVLELKNQTQK